MPPGNSCKVLLGLLGSTQCPTRAGLHWAGSSSRAHRATPRPTGQAAWLGEMPGEAKSQPTKTHPVNPRITPGSGNRAQTVNQGRALLARNEHPPTENAGGRTGPYNQHCRSWGDCPASDHPSGHHTWANGGLERCKPAVGESFLPVLTMLYCFGKRGICADTGESCSSWCLRCKTWWEPQGLLQTCCSA